MMYDKFPEYICKLQDLAAMLPGNPVKDQYINWYAST